MNVNKSLTDLIGNTPMLELCRYGEKHGLHGKIIAKLEYFNPLGSIKDRAAYAMILEGEKNGKIKPGTVIIEPTSGNTGVGLAYICAVRGYRIILTMPESMSLERRSLLAALGAEIQLTSASTGMKGAIERANQLSQELPDTFMPAQFSNPANPQVHRDTTAQEIWRDTDGKVDVLVAAFGTGGTVTGVGEALKEKRGDIEVVGVEPASSPVASGGQPGPHKIQGIGAGFLPDNLNVSIMDKILTVSNEDAFAATRELALTEGLLVGISSGAAVYAARQLAAQEDYREKNIVAILPDTGERYLSTGVFTQAEGK